MLNRLESEKTALISELNKLRQEKKVWEIQRSELEMTQAELSAENTQLRSELNNKVLLLSHYTIWFKLRVGILMNNQLNGT